MIINLKIKFCSAPELLTNSEKKSTTPAFEKYKEMQCPLFSVTSGQVLKWTFELIPNRL
jgi:hypothetical protein